MSADDSRVRAEILNLVRDRAATPEGRSKVAAVLWAALAVIDPRVTERLTPDSVGVDVAIRGLVEQLTIATEHAEYLREVMRPPGH